MKVGPASSMPWDMVVFLTITTVGFGYSVKHVMDHSVTPAHHAAESGDSTDRDGSTSVTQKVIDLGCLDERLHGDHITSQEGAVRIRGRICYLNRKQMKRFAGLSVKNLSNGYEGTVFFQGSESAFVSDPLVLQSGRNQIQIEWRDSEVAEPKMLVAEVFEK